MNAALLDFILLSNIYNCQSVVRAPIVRKNEDSVYSNYKEKKLFIRKVGYGGRSRKRFPLPFWD